MIVVLFVWDRLKVAWGQELGTDYPGWHWVMSPDDTGHCHLSTKAALLPEEASINPHSPRCVRGHQSSLLATIHVHLGPCMSPLSPVYESVCQVGVPPPGVNITPELIMTLFLQPLTLQKGRGPSCSNCEVSQT